MIIIKFFGYIFFGIPLVFLTLHTIIRIIRHIYKFPMPEFAADLIDNPLRRRIQPPDETAIRHRIREGMTVLEVGPGNGTYTLAAGRRIGEHGKLITIDIEPRMITRTEAKIKQAGVRNIEARLANVYELAFADAYFDLIYMIAVIGEIPTPKKAIAEFHRVLKPGGTLVFSELLMDPDYPLAGTLKKLAAPTGFQFKEKRGNFFYYTLIFEKTS